MKGGFKKFAGWVCLIASVLVIGTSVSGWISDKDTDKDKGTDTTIENVIEE